MHTFTVQWNLSLTELGLDGNFFSPEDPKLGTCVNGKLRGTEKKSVFYGAVVGTFRCIFLYNVRSKYFSLL